MVAPPEPQSGFHGRHLVMAARALIRVEILLHAKGYIKGLVEIEKDKILGLTELVFDELIVGDFDEDALVDRAVLRYIAEHGGS